MLQSFEFEFTIYLGLNSSRFNLKISKYTIIIIKPILNKMFFT